MKWIVTSLVTFGLTASASAEDLRLLVSWPTGNPANTMAVQFQEIVKEVGKGAINIELVGPDVVPPAQQLQPVSAGAFDMFLTVGAYHAGEKGLAVVLDGIAPDPAKRRESGVLEFLDTFYQKEHNIKILGVALMGSVGYHCILKESLTPEGNWAGRKIRGAVTHRDVVEELGGSLVTLPVAETYAGLERGVVDGSCMPGGTMESFRLYEVAKYRVEPYYGTVNLIYGINLDKWNSLSEESQAILVEAVEKTEAVNLAFGDTALAKEREELEKHGVKVEKMPPALADKVFKTFDDSNWALGATCCGDAAAQMREIAKKAGLAQ